MAIKPSLLVRHAAKMLVMLRETGTISVVEARAIGRQLGGGNAWGDVLLNYLHKNGQVRVDWDLEMVFVPEPEPPAA